MLDAVIALSGAIMDTIDYAVKFPLAKLNKPKEKEYPDLWDTLDGKVAVMVNLYAPETHKLDELSNLHTRGKFRTYLPWVHLALNNGTQDLAEYVHENNPKLNSTYLFGLGADKAANISSIIQDLPEEIDTIVIKDYYSKIQDFDTFLKALHDFRESDGGAMAVPIVPNKDPNWAADNLLRRWQEHEYDLSMNLGRRALGLFGASTVSGACSVFKRDTLEQIIDDNSFDWIGEDFENSVLVFSNNQKIYFDPRPKVVATHSPANYNRLYLQRRGWERARLKITNDYLFKPLKAIWQDFKENNILSTLQKKNTKTFKEQLKNVTKDAFYSYQFYIQNGLFETLGMIPKAYSVGIIGLAAANFIETNLGSNILPETIKLLPTDYDISVSANAFKVYATGLAAWSGLNIFHLSQSDLPKKKGLKAAALYPAYKLGLLLPSLAGAGRFAKELYRMNIRKDKSVNRFEECANSHSIMKRGYGGHAEIPEQFKSGTYFQNEFFSTDFHDILFARLDPEYVKAQNLPESPIYGVANLVNRELAIYPLDRFTHLLEPQLSIDNIEFNPKREAIQEGYILNESQAYRFDDGRHSYIFTSDKGNFECLGKDKPGKIEPHEFELYLAYDNDRFIWIDNEKEIMSGDITLADISPEPYR
ncbi:MAG: glycosyltransferase family 2 protein [Candidatus Woesearchaeota archaeon]